MRNRLVITLVLGALLAVVAAGAVSAQSNDVSVNLPGGGTVDTGEALPACSNLGDDDGDGLVDLGDPGCSSALDGDETDTAPPTTTTTTTTDSTTTTTDEDTTTTDGDETDQPPRDDPDDLPGGKDPFGGKDGKDDGRSFSVRDESRDGRGDDDDEDGGSGSIPTPEIRRPDGAPTNANPTVTISSTGAAPIGVPNFVIEQFSIPPFLLPIYQACGTQYDIPWEVLASINRIETAFGTNLNVSTAGAQGWMQFMPPTWEMYGVDANNDGRKDPYNPVDAICAAARYLNAAGGKEDLYQAIFAYNHADWYVDEVLLYAKQYGNLPSGLIDSLTGLTEGAHFPVAAKSRYADDISERQALRRATPTPGTSGNAADVIADSPTRRGIDIYSKEGAPVVAANDGVITKVGQNKRLGRFIVLRDAYGNEYTYAGLGKIAKAIPVPKQKELTSRDFDLVRPGAGDKKPKISASETTRAQTIHNEAEADGKDDSGHDGGGEKADAKEESGPTNTEDSRERLFALPRRQSNGSNDGAGAGIDDLLGKGIPGYETFKSYFSGVLRFDEKTMDTAPLRKGATVVGGTIIGKVGQTDPDVASHLHFEITPAGRGARSIDPKPILDGWKLLEATAIYRAAGKNPFDDQASVGQALLASKSQLQRQILADPRVEIYSCGRDDIATGQIDRRVMAMLEYLVARGYRLTITSLKCGHSIMTTSGNVSAHSTGDAVDIAMVNGIPIYGNQGNGSITEAVITDLLKLQGSMQPAQIISLMEMGGPTFAMGDHDDHIHVGYTPDGTDNGEPISGLLKPEQWDKLLDRLSELDQPTVPVKPSDAALPARKGDKASNAHIGE
ncbi:MAG TPA: peptidoglycan DD-metalloendopeptidase family protein [Solirubrobacterales bacterium]|nr:peptidoglycan DD-metalloendopeptidase family protein [Solirubrobacterales bacterium]